MANIMGTYLLKPVINNYILPGDIPGLIRMIAFMGLMYALGASAVWPITSSWFICPSR